MSYQKRTIKHLTDKDNTQLTYAARSHAKTCLGALYKSYRYDHKCQFQSFKREYGLTEEVAFSVVAFGETKARNKRGIK